MEIQLCRCSRPGIPINTKTAGWVEVILEAEVAIGNSLPIVYFHRALPESIQYQQNYSIQFQTLTIHMEGLALDLISRTSIKK